MGQAVLTVEQELAKWALELAVGEAESEAIKMESVMKSAEENYDFVINAGKPAQRGQGQP